MNDRITFHISENPWDKCWSSGRFPDGKSTVFARGYAFSRGRLYEREGLARFFIQELTNGNDADPEQAFLTVLEKLNGYFAVAWLSEGGCMAAVDRVRSCPLFYRKSGGRLRLAADPRLLLGEGERFQLNEEAGLEFLLTGFVTGSDTLHPEIKQISQGQFIAAKCSAGREEVDLEVQTYFRFFDEKVMDAGDEELEERLNHVLESVFTRYCENFRSKKLIMPLSGGLDSRLVLAMMKKGGLDNITCFSYGDPKSLDARISDQIAGSLGLKWKFVEYKGWDDWHSLKNDRMFLDYLNYGSTMSSIAHQQDWPAARQLLRESENDAPVFVPGHTGDFISGGHLPPDLVFDKRVDRFGDIAADAIFGHHYDLWPLAADCSDIRERMIGKIKSFFQVDPWDMDMAAKCYEHWEWGGRQSRFIINSLRIYEFFGCPWAMPLWDDELMRFFIQLGVNAKYKKRIYINTMMKKVFTGRLAVLGKIPVESTTPLVYRSQKDPLPSLPMTKRTTNAILHTPVINWAPKMLQSYRHDPFHIYGFFMRRPRYPNMLDSTRSLLNNFGSIHQPEVRRVLEPNLGMPIFYQSLRGLFSARYLSSLGLGG